MRCSRCRGLMVHENFYTLEIANLYEWRCVACGEIVDRVILKNRTMQGISARTKAPRNLTRNGQSLVKNKPSTLPHCHQA